MKLDINGNTLWPDTLIGFLPDSEPYKGGGCFPDGEGGVIGVYKDQVNSTYPDFPIVVNRVDAQGNYLFGDSGIVAINHPVLFTRYAQDVSLGLYVSTFQIQIGDVVQRATREWFIEIPWRWYLGRTRFYFRWWARFGSRSRRWCFMFLDRINGTGR